MKSRQSDSGLPSRNCWRLLLMASVIAAKRGQPDVRFPHNNAAIYQPIVSRERRSTYGIWSNGEDFARIPGLSVCDVKFATMILQQQSAAVCQPHGVISEICPT